MKSWLAAISPLLFPLLSAGQHNLVPNGSFEAATQKEFPCSWLVDDDNINHYLYNWFTPVGTTTDVMSTNSPDGCWSHAPETGEGTMAPHSGNNMVGFINYSPDGGCQPNEWHEYLSVELTETLVPGNLYCVEFWIALGDKSFYATNNIGILLSTQSIERGGCEPIFNKPQINITRVINNTSEWLRIDASFLADSSYRFLTIGNFFPHAETVIEERGGHHPAQKPQGTPVGEGQEIELETESSSYSYMAYYFIDDVKLYLCPSAQLPKPAEEQ